MIFRNDHYTFYQISEFGSSLERRWISNPLQSTVELRNLSGIFRNDNGNGLFPVYLSTRSLCFSFLYFMKKRWENIEINKSENVYWAICCICFLRVTSMLNSNSFKKTCRISDEMFAMVPVFSTSWHTSTSLQHRHRSRCHLLEQLWTILRDTCTAPVRWMCVSEQIEQRNTHNRGTFITNTTLVHRNAYMLSLTRHNQYVRISVGMKTL